MKTRLVRIIIILLVVFGGLVGFNLFRDYKIKEFFKHYTPPAVSVSTVRAYRKTWHPTIPGVGSFIAINGVDVNSEASGNVTDIFFRSGQYVKKNKSLIQIDDSIERATLKDAQAQLALNKISYKRQSDLIKTQSTSSSSVDKAKAALAESNALVEKIQAQINQKNIKAPFSGRLGVRQVNLGQYITPGNTKIVTLQSMDPLYLHFYLPEQFVKKLYVGQPIRFRVEAYPGLYFEGKINAINSKIDIDTHNVLVQASLPNCPRDLLKHQDSGLAKTKEDPLINAMVTHCSTTENNKQNINSFSFIPGMFADIEVILPSIEDVIVVPRTAISYSLYGNSVFIVKIEKDKDTQKSIKRVYKRFISTGEERGNEVIITQGVQEHDEIVNSGQLKLQNGTHVTINNSVKLNESPNISAIGE